MVVDDVDFNLDILTPLITERGVQVVTASSGEEAIDKLARDKNIALILMDIGLPGISGIEAARAIKDNPATACIPVIALTAEIENADLEAIKQAGMRGYLEKNFDPDQLWQEIDRVILSYDADPCPAPNLQVKKTSSAPVLHYELLLESFGNKETVQQVAIAFFKDAIEQLNTIEQSIESCNMKKLSEACHSLKGSSHLFTADQLAETAEKLYSFSRQERCNQLESHFITTKNSFNTLRKFVNDKLNLSI
jgi:two-component system sensor histidine kinase BarA